MQNINYKYTTFGLLFLLVLIVSWNHNTIFGSGNYMNNEYMGVAGNNGTHMMRMSNGSMMRMNNGDMMMNNGTVANTNMTMDSMMTSMVAGLKGKSGEVLEKEFITEMIPHHQGAVDMAKILLADPTIKPDLKKFAEGIISAQEAEISQMNLWLKNYK